MSIPPAKNSRTVCPKAMVATRYPRVWLAPEPRCRRVANTGPDIVYPVLSLLIAPADALRLGKGVRRGRALRRFQELSFRVMQALAAELPYPRRDGPTRFPVPQCAALSQLRARRDCAGPLRAGRPPSGPGSRSRILPCGTPREPAPAPRPVATRAARFLVLLPGARSLPRTAREGEGQLVGVALVDCSHPVDVPGDLGAVAHFPQAVLLPVRLDRRLDVCSTVSRSASSMSFTIPRPTSAYS